MKKKIITLLVAVLVLASIFLPKTLAPTILNAAELNTNNCKSVVLIERKTGKVLVENNSNEQLPIASVTKLMTVLLTLEHIDNGFLSLDDEIMVSENASGMGGSQVFIDANSKYKVGELLKSVIVASANDSSVALAEQIAGSENNFVKLMNERANELRLKHTHYSNCTGLPSVDGYSSAYDQALLLNEVLKYDDYHKYSSIWMEDFVHPSGRTTQMTNTNRLSRFYDGCIGGKTGSTNQAKYCLAVGAKRNDMELIAVVLGAENSKERFNIARDLLDYGFANYKSKTLFNSSNLAKTNIPIKGTHKATSLYAEKEFSTITPINEEINFSLNYNLPNQLIKCNKGDIVGNVDIVIEGKVVETINILATDTIAEASVWDYIKDLIKN